VSKNLPLYCLFHVTINIHFCFYVNAERDVVTVLLIFLHVYIYHFTYTFSHAHTEAHIHKKTCIVPHKRNGDSRHRSLVERGGRKASVRDKSLAHTQKGKRKKDKKSEETQIFTNLKKKDSST